MKNPSVKFRIFALSNDILLYQLLGQIAIFNFLVICFLSLYPFTIKVNIN
jgi:hypothetical protein